MRRSVLLVSQLYYPHRGGVENSLEHMARAFLALGYSPIIVCSSLPGSDGQVLPLIEKVNGIDVRRYPLKKRRGIFSLLAPFEEIRSSRQLLRELVQNDDVTLIVARHYLAGLSCINICKNAVTLYVVPGIIRTQNSPTLLNRSGIIIKRVMRDVFSRFLLLPLHAFLQARFASKVDHCVVFSENMRHQVAKQLGCKTAIKIPPGVDAERFAPKGKCFNSTSKVTTCLVLGRLNPAKSVELAIRAISILGRDFPVRLQIVGDGPERGILESLVKDLDCGDTVLFFDSTTHAESYYKNADVFLMTSRYEPFGQTILEAMSSGVPVIGFRADPSQGIIVANEEIIEDGRTGFLCDFGANGLVEALQRYLTLDTTARKMMSNHARRHAIQHYSWDRMCRSLLELAR